MKRWQPLPKKDSSSLPLSLLSLSLPPSLSLSLSLVFGRLTGGCSVFFLLNFVADRGGHRQGRGREALGVKVGLRQRRCAGHPHQVPGVLPPYLRLEPNAVQSRLQGKLRDQVSPTPPHHHHHHHHWWRPMLRSMLTLKTFLFVRLIEIPGWYDVMGPDRVYPGHSRVSHSKFIVSDQLVNIGTSNMEWSYFHSTAGVSFNADNAYMIEQVRHMFELAWDHPNYTHPIYY